MYNKNLNNRLFIMINYYDNIIHIYKMSTSILRDAKTEKSIKTTKS